MIRTVRDGKPVTATSIFTQLLSSDNVELLRSSFPASVTENVAGPMHKSLLDRTGIVPVPASTRSQTQTVNYYCTALLEITIPLVLQNDTVQMLGLPFLSDIKTNTNLTKSTTLFVYSSVAVLGTASAQIKGPLPRLQNYQKYRLLR